ncbi:MAG: glutamate racemase [Candidatus Brocadiae bacterium]|nr:glutamate racemase [Candidatus Brocadiia bacterium]
MTEPALTPEATRPEAARPIAIFDSGLGGLTVMREVARALPHEDLIYFGDTARVPYGIKSPQTIIHFSEENCRFLCERDPKLIVVACNTASAAALPHLREHLDVPVLGVVAPGARAAVAATRNRRVGIIGTEATIKSRAYIESIRAVDPTISLINRACPLFVPLVEEGRTCDDPVVRLVAKQYLRPIREFGADTLVLGCTHYPLLKAALRQQMGRAVTIVDSAEETARATAALLDEMHLRRRDGETPAYRYFVTDNPVRFASVGSRIMRDIIENVSLVDLDAIARRPS